jgi:hypothetical protein
MAREGTISVSTALAYATNRTNLQLTMHDLGADNEE